MGAGFQGQVVDEIACFFQGDVFLRAVVLEDAKGIVRADFTAGQVDVFSRFAVAEDDDGHGTDEWRKRHGCRLGDDGRRMV